jgi:ArsR family transcriptional regulator, arsenate/arsenite/antimonite-responsive transcriptional repressor
LIERFAGADGLDEVFAEKTVLRMRGHRTDTERTDALTVDVGVFDDEILVDDLRELGIHVSHIVRGRGGEVGFEQARNQADEQRDNDDTNTKKSLCFVANLSHICIGEYQEEPMRQMQYILEGLAEVTRLRILNLVIHFKQVCVVDLQKTLHFSQPKLSRHLIYLKNHGWLQDQRHGAFVFYRFKEPLPPAAQTMRPILQALFDLDPQFTQDRLNFNKMRMIP